MKNLRNPWEHFAEAFSHFDRGWASADAGFRSVSNKSPKERRIHVITASSWWSRIRLVGLFSKLAIKILFCGSVTIKLQTPP